MIVKLTFWTLKLSELSFESSWQSVPFECLVFPKNSNYHIIPELLLELVKVAQYAAMSSIFSQIGLAVGDIESIKKEAALQKHSVQVGRGRQKVVLVTVSGWLCCAVFFSLVCGFLLLLTVLLCAVLCNAVLCSDVLCCTVLCCVALCCAVLRSRSFFVLFWVVFLLRCVALRCVTLRCVLLYCAPLH